MKFLYGYFHPDTGQSIVALADKSGVYTGSAKLHPDDKQHASKYAGCRLAHKRAWISKLQKQFYKKKIMFKTIQNLKKDIENTCNSYYNRKIQRRINLKLRDYSNQIKELEQTIKKLKEDIKKEIEIRDNLIRRTK